MNSLSRSGLKKKEYDHKISKGREYEEIRFDIEDLNELDKESNEKIDDSVSRTSNSRSEEVNKKSVMVKNIDFEATLDEIEKLFSKFGLVNKVTLICDKYSGRSKGTACVEYESEDAKDKSLEMDNQQFQKKVLRVEGKTREIPLYLGRREKCYNINMVDYFISTKNNFGPIKIKKSLKKRYEPY